MIISEEINILVSSDPSLGAQNINDKGSEFEIVLEDGGIQVPNEAKNVNIVVEESTVWWTVPNLEQGINDKMYITGPNAQDQQTDFIITIPQGLYDLPGLNQAILRELENAGAKINPEPLFLLLPDSNTQRVVIRFSYNTVSIDFTPGDTFRDILGFNSQLVGPISPAPASVIGDNTAAFNQVNYFLLHSDLTNKGIRYNNRYDQVVSQVNINVPPGSQIVSTPFNPAKVEANELRGVNRTNIRFWLTDQNNRLVNTAAEFFSMRLCIRYNMPFIFQKQN